MVILLLKNTIKKIINNKKERERERDYYKILKFLLSSSTLNNIVFFA